MGYAWDDDPDQNMGVIAVESEMPEGLSTERLAKLQLTFVVKRADGNRVASEYCLDVFLELAFQNI